MKKKIISTLLCFVATTVLAQEDSQTGYNFLRLPVSAHAGALGGENISIIEDDATLMFGNPALAGSVSDKTLSLCFMNYMQGALMGSAAFTKVVSEKGTFGITGQLMNYGSMKEVDENNVVTGDFSAKEIALAGILAYQLGSRIVGGITARASTAYIGQYNSLAVGIDLGVNYYDPEKEWSLSAVARNLGGEVDAFDEEYARMPLDVQIGVSKRLIGSPLRLSMTLADLNHPSYKLINHAILGADILLSEQFYLALGYSFRRASEMEVVAAGEERGSSHGAGLALGAGLSLDRFKLSLAYAKYHVSSNSLMLNVSFNL